MKYMVQWDKLSGSLLAVVSSATFGLIPLFSISLFGAGVGSPTILCYRFLLAAAVMAVMVVFTRRSFRLAADEMAVVALLAVLYASTAILLLESYKDIPSGIATTIHFIYPLVVTLIMSFLFGERMAKVVYLSVVLSLVGVALLACGAHSDGDYGHGVTLALLSVITYAVYIVGVVRSRIRQVDSVVLTFYVLAVGAALLVVYALTTSGIEALHGWDEWRDMIMLALVCTVLSNYTLVLAAKRIGSTRTSILGSMEPLIAMVVGVVCLGERVDVVSIVGLILIIVAVVVVIVQSTTENK